METIDRFENKHCCVCGDPARSCYGRFVRGKSLFFPVCGKHMLSSEQKCALLSLPFREKTDDEILSMMLGTIRFYHAAGDGKYEKKREIS